MTSRRDDEWDEEGKCRLCFQERTENGHDPCIANLPGVLYACCGHGTGRGYIKFEDGRTLRFVPTQMDLNFPTHEFIPRRGGEPVPVFVKGEERILNFKRLRIEEPFSNVTKKDRHIRLIKKKN